MGVSVKRLVRDRLVNDADMRTLLGVTTTGSAPVNPVFMEQTALYPRIVYSELPGPTNPGISGTNGIITFGVYTVAISGINPHATAENITERIDQLFDDQVVTGLAISGTAVYAPLFLREGGTDLAFDPTRRDYTRFLTYSYKVLKY